MSKPAKQSLGFRGFVVSAVGLVGLLFSFLTGGASTLEAVGGAPAGAGSAIQAVSNAFEASVTALASLVAAAGALMQLVGRWRATTPLRLKE